MIRKLFRDCLKCLPGMEKKFYLQDLQALTHYLSRVDGDFNSPTVSFRDIVKSLYDFTKPLNIAVEDDYDWYRSLRLPLHTRTSKKAFELVSKVLNPALGPIGLVEDYFITPPPTGWIHFTQWYSSHTTTEGFVEYMRRLVEVYVLYHSEEVELEHQYVIDEATLVFLSTYQFKLILRDYIALLRVMTNKAMEKSHAPIAG